MEDWNDIPKYEGIYQASTKGNIRNTKGKILKPWKINSGYLVIRLHKDGVKRSWLVHRLIVKTFIEGTLQGKEVNHLNGNKVDNSIGNLELCTSSENKLHALSTGLKVYNRPSLGKIRNTSGSVYHNVAWDKYRSKWKTSIWYKGKTVGQKRFNSETEAALYVNKILIDYNITDRPFNIIKENK